MDKSFQRKKDWFYEYDVIGWVTKIIQGTFNQREIESFKAIWKKAF